MSQLRNLLTNGVLKYRGYDKSARRAYFKWYRIAAAQLRAYVRSFHKGA